MTTLNGTADSFSDSLVGPTAGQPRTAASVNTGLQQALNNEYALSRGYQTFRWTTGASALNNLEEKFTWVNVGTTASHNVTFDFTDAQVGAFKRVVYDNVDQDTVLTFKNDGTTFLTWTAEASFRQLSFLFFKGGAGWNLVEASSPWRGMAVYSQADLSALGGTLTVTEQMQDVHIHQGDAAGENTQTLGGTYRMSDDVPGAIHNFYFNKLANSATPSFEDGSGTEFFSYNVRGTEQQVVITVGYTREIGWRCIGVQTNERADPGMLYVATSPANATYNPNIYRYIMLGPVESQVGVALSGTGTYYGQECTLSVRRCQAPNGRVLVTYSDQQYVLDTSDEDSPNIEKAMTIVWVAADTDRWVLKSGSEQT